MAKPAATAEPVSDPVSKTAGALVREWTRAELEGRTEVRAPELVRDCLADLVTPEMLLELGRLAVYKTILEVIGETRDGRAAATHALDVDLTTLEPAERTARLDALRQRWLGHLEHSGTRHVVLSEMTARDLLRAMGERRRQVRSELAVIDWYAALYKRLRGTDLTVGQAMTADEIEQYRRAAYRKNKVAI